MSFALNQFFMDDIIPGPGDKDTLRETIYLVAVDSIRIGINTDLINMVEGLLKVANSDNELMFLDTWGLPNGPVAEARDRLQMRQVLINATATVGDAGKSIPASIEGQDNQVYVNGRRDTIMLLGESDEAHIRIGKAKETGNQYASSLVDEIDSARAEWESLEQRVNIGEITANSAMKEWQEYVLIPDGPGVAARRFLKGSLSENQNSAVVDYIRTSTNFQDGKEQIITCAAAGETLYDDTTKLKMILWDLGKTGWVVGNPMLVATMILICDERVKRLTMGEPNRGSRNFIQAEMMLELCVLTNTETCFARSLGKDGKDLAVAGEDRNVAWGEAREEFNTSIRTIAQKHLDEESKQTLYKAIRAIYYTKPNQQEEGGVATQVGTDDDKLLQKAEEIGGLH